MTLKRDKLTIWTFQSSSQHERWRAQHERDQTTARAVHSPFATAPALGSTELQHCSMAVHSTSGRQSLRHSTCTRQHGTSAGLDGGTQHERDEARSHRSSITQWSMVVWVASHSGWRIRASIHESFTGSESARTSRKP